MGSIAEGVGRSLTFSFPFAKDRGFLDGSTSPVKSSIFVVTAGLVLWLLCSLSTSMAMAVPVRFQRWGKKASAPAEPLWYCLGSLLKGLWFPIRFLVLKKESMCISMSSYRVMADGISMIARMKPVSFFLTLIFSSIISLRLEAAFKISRKPPHLSPM